jgi:hypothetical protein
VEGQIRAQGLPVARLRELLPADTGAVVHGGTLALEARVGTEGARYTVEGTARMEGLRLGGAEAPVRGRLREERQVPHERPEAARVSLTGVELEGPGVKLGGEATATFEPARVRFNLAGPYLHLDTLLGAMPEEAQGTGGAGGEAEPLLSPEARKRLRGMDVAGTLRVDTVSKGSLEAKQVEAVATLQGGELRFSRLRGQVYGGALSGEGTRVALGGPQPTWRLEARLEGLKLGQALQSLSGESPVTGRVRGQLSLEGRGSDWERLREKLTGRGEMVVEEGEWATNLDGLVGNALAAGLKLGGAGPVAEALEGGPTRLRQPVRVHFRVEDGWLRLTQPLHVETAHLQGDLSGAVGLDGRLSLQGTPAIGPELLGGVTRGALKLAGPVRLPLRIQGTLGQPVVSVETQGLVRQMLRSPGTEKPGQTLKDLFEQLGP